MIPLSVLVIDDDAGVRQSIRLCLEVEGYRVMGVGSAAAAMEALDRGRFDLCFLDLWLGPDSGLAVLPEILRRQPGIGAVVITAFATIESAVEAMRSGAADYLPKPFSPDQVRLLSASILTLFVVPVMYRILAPHVKPAVDAEVQTLSLSSHAVSRHDIGGTGPHVIDGRREPRSLTLVSLDGSVVDAIHVAPRTPGFNGEACEITAPYTTR